MTFKEMVYAFLQVDKQFCYQCGKPLKFPYKKIAGWDQYMVFTPKHLWQALFGDNVVWRFCGEECMLAFGFKPTPTEPSKVKA